MRLRFTQGATQDLIEIAEFIGRENPAAAERVRAAILDGLQILLRFPHLGRRQSAEGVRKYVTRRYRYGVYYAADEAAGEVIVLAIRHPARRPL
jgi:plasmid stabilization system protein ParE